MAEIVPIEQLSYKIEFLRSKQKDLAIVATNGCFDILHIGHVRSLQKAKTLGDLLIVGINSDSSVQKIKGSSRPINPQNERAEIIASLECVDLVSIFKEETAEKFLDMVKPNIYVKGGEYNLDNLPEVKIVKKYNGKVVTVPMIPGFSTTELIKKLKNI